MSFFKDVLKTANKALGSPVGGLAGDLFGGWLTNRWGSQSVSRANAFSERMANTSHQREVADLRAAGLNPILSATRGADSPSGLNQPIVNAVSAGISSARANRQLEKDLSLAQSMIDKQDEEAKLLRDQQRLAEQQWGMNNTSWDKLAAEKIRAQWEAMSAKELYRQSVIDTELRGYMVPGAKEEAKFWQQEGQLAKYLRNIIAPAFNAAKSLR